jgi:uncharacterized protein involved in exopolysaccharide biosynthesis
LLEGIPETIVLGHTVGMPLSAVASMREQLFVAEIREQELLSRFTRHHPQAIAAAKHIAALKAVLAGEPVEPQVARGPNRAHQEMNLASLKGASSVSSLQAQAATLRKQLAPVERELKSFNDAEADFARLQREIDIETENYKRYSDCLEQSRIDHELGLKNISNLNVLQPPTYSVTPTHPRPLVNLSVGFIVALMSSFGLGMFLEHRRTGFLYRWAWPGPRDLGEFLMRSGNGRFNQGLFERPWDEPADHPLGASVGESSGNGSDNHVSNGDEPPGKSQENG